MKPIYRYLLFFVLMLPAFIFRDYTPDNELRYISLAIEALRDGTWFTFYDHGVVYADKPPLYLWYVMSVHFILGSYPMWAVGLSYDFFSASHLRSETGVLLRFSQVGIALNSLRRAGISRIYL